MTLLAGPLHIVCGVLAIAGVAKLISPAPTRRAIAALGPTVPLVAVRVLGLAETSLAVATVAMGGIVLPIAIAALHIAFVGVVVRLGRDGAVSCGCFGSADTPPSTVHVIANLVSAAIAIAAIGIGGLGDVVEGQPGAGAIHAGFVVLGSAAAVLVLRGLPMLTSRAPRSAQPFALVTRR